MCATGKGQEYDARVPQTGKEPAKSTLSTDVSGAKLGFARGDLLAHCGVTVTPQLANWGNRSQCVFGMSFY